MINVQIENTLVKSVNDLLINSDIPANQININNLINFIQAIVLFDKVKLPARPRRTYLPVELIPDTLKKEDIFEVLVVEDFSYRMEKADVGTSSIAEAFLKSSRSKEEKFASKGNLLIEFINKELIAKGAGWRKVFWRDVEDILKGKSNYEREGVAKVLLHFNSSEYDTLTAAEKVGIYYLWRCYYNLELAIDNESVYLQNLTRLPLSKIIYEQQRKNLIQSPLLENCPFDLKSWVIENMAPGTPSQSWIQTLPTLLHDVLLSARCERNKVAEAILEMRNSKQAETFRKHFRKIREELSMAGAMQNMNDDIEHLLKLWSNISDLSQEPGKIAIPFLKMNFSDTGKVLLNLLKFPYLALRLKHLNIFWTKVPKRKRFNKELAGLIKKTFGVAT